MYVHTSIPPTPSPSLSLPLSSPLYFYPANEYSLCSHASGTPFRSHTQLRTSLRLLISRSFWDRCVFLIFSFFITNFSRYSLSLSLSLSLFLLFISANLTPFTFNTFADSSSSSSSPFLFTDYLY